MDERDRRGATALVAVGVAGLAATAWYLWTAVDMGTLPMATAGAGLSIVVTVAGLMRLWRGRLLSSPITRMDEHLKATPGWGRGLGRLGGYLIDTAVLLVLVLLAFSLFRIVDLRGSWSSPSGALDARGIEYLKMLAPSRISRYAVDDLSVGLAVLVGGLWLVVPAATWGGTFGLLTVGRVWARTDGMRVGAVHGALRAISGQLIAPLQAALTVLSFFSGGRRYVRGRVYSSRWGLAMIATARRTLADVICRTEPLHRKRAEDGRG